MDATNSLQHGIISRAWHLGCPDMRSGKATPVPAKPMLSAHPTPRPIRPERAAQVDIKLRQKVVGNWPALHKAFHTIDLDNSGSINKQELRKCLDRYCVALPNREFEDLFRRIDGNGNGRLEWKEFMEYFATDGAEFSTPISDTANDAERRMKTRYMSADSLEVKVRELMSKHSTEVCNTLLLLDQDHAGTLHRSELRKLMDRFSLPMSDGQFQRLLSKLRSDGDRVFYKHLLGHFKINPPPKLLKTIKQGDAKAASEQRRRARRPATVQPAALPAHLAQPVVSTVPVPRIAAPGGPRHALAGDYRWDDRWNKSRPDTAGSATGPKMEVEEAVQALRVHMNKWATAQSAFRAIDVDGSGILEASELSQVFARLNIAIKPHVASTIARQLGALRAGGGINYNAFKKHFGEEFGMASSSFEVGKFPRTPKLRAKTPGAMSLEAAESALINKLSAHTSQLHKAFQGIDLDGSGQLDIREFGRVLANLNIKVSAQNLAKLVQRFDIDRSGGVDYAEFCRKLNSPSDSNGMFRWDGHMGGQFSHRLRGKRTNIK